MSNLHDTDYQIQFKSGTSTNINKTATVNSAVEGEPHYTTDTHKMYVFNGTANERVHGLDMAIVCDGDVVTSNGEIVWLS